MPKNEQKKNWFQNWITKKTLAKRLTKREIVITELSKNIPQDFEDKALKSNGDILEETISGLITIFLILESTFALLSACFDYNSVLALLGYSFLGMAGILIIARVYTMTCNMD